MRGALILAVVMTVVLAVFNLPTYGLGLVWLVQALFNFLVYLLLGLLIVGIWRVLWKLTHPKTQKPLG